MSAVLSIVTANELLHVSDLPPEGPRTLVLRHPTSTGLLTVVGPEPPVRWVARAAADAREEAGALARHLRDAGHLEVDLDFRGAFLLTGWGHDGKGRDHTFRYVVSNLEGEEGYQVTGESLTPDRVLRRDAAAPYSVQIVATEEQPRSTRRRLEGLPRLIRRGDWSAIALEAATIVREIAPGPVLLAHLAPDGTLEAAKLVGQELVPLEAESDSGTSEIRG